MLLTYWIYILLLLHNPYIYPQSHPHTNTYAPVSNSLAIRQKHHFIQEGCVLLVVSMYIQFLQRVWMTFFVLLKETLWDKKFTCLEHYYQIPLPYF